MRFNSAALVVLLSLHGTGAFSPAALSARVLVGMEARNRLSVSLPIEVTSATSNSVYTEEAALEWKDITCMTYRQLQKHLRARDLDPIGTTAVLRERLHMATGGECVVLNDETGKTVGECEEEIKIKGIEFIDESDPDFDFKDLVTEILDKAQINHWKVATRRLKQLKRRYATPERKVPEEVYLAALRACMENRLSGARASEPARKILEDMSDDGYKIPFDVVNFCILNTLGDGPDGTHDSFGGIDCALAMISAVESSVEGQGKVSEETYGRAATVLSNCGEIDESLAMLRSMIVDKSFTPSLGVFSDIAVSAVTHGPEKVMDVLAFAKAAGYELDNIASTVDGRTLLAAGVVAAEKIDNVPLGLRLLTAASKAQGCDPDRGDNLVAASSSSAQRAATLIHKRAINKAVEDGQWKLAVKLLELMLERSLKPSPAVWKSIITCCAKNEKSKKATALLLDWVKLAEAGEIEKPPISVFNNIVNACEICNEQELTLLVLDAMKKTHDIDGNIITFNIALKRLAKQGNVAACEGIIIGMIQQGIEPSVVSYTTAIAACATEGRKNPTYAYEWLKRMRSRNVKPNKITYNTALAACQDGKVESTILASKIATEMLEDVDNQLAEGIVGNEYTNVIPDYFTKATTREIMMQLRDNWQNGEIDKAVAKATIRKPLLEMVEFSKSERAAAAIEQASAAKAGMKEEEDLDATQRDEAELEYATVSNMHRTAEV